MQRERTRKRYQEQVHKWLIRRTKSKTKRTEAEIAMKELLDRHFPGFKDQWVIDHYVVDFFHSRRRLVIEVDGEYHFFRGKQDGFRTLRLKRMGYRVVRFTNHEVLETPELVIEKVTALRGPEFAIRTS